MISVPYCFKSNCKNAKTMTYAHTSHIHKIVVFHRVVTITEIV